ncbi:MAG: glycosyltransferase family 39 protein [Deltaproteobacteria bacterium]|nr:glycosyltransferase family 39 protein [Deltaproteobacteria bacterium]
MSRAEAGIAAALLAVQLVLRAALVLRQRFDSDEPQHLHVAWAWTQGLVPYRDFFDNHTPLFHLLMAPLAAAAGERADILIAMRLAMLPLAGLSLWILYRIGRSLFSARVGVWSAVLVGLLPGFLFSSVEFRSDNLWTVLWLAAIAVALGGPLRPARSFAAGLLAGAALAASMKTAVLLGALGGGVVAALALDPRRRRWLHDRALRGALAAAAAGTTLCCTAGLAALAALGALSPFVDRVLLHNAGAADLWAYRLPRGLLFAAALPLLLVATREIRRRSSSRGLSRSAIFAAAMLYGAIINAFSPFATRQNSLPWYPFAALFAVAGSLAVLEARGRSARPRAVPLLVSVAAIEVGLALWFSPLWKDGTSGKIGLVAEVLRLTGPRDPVLDLKGETLFRRRAVDHVFENVTVERFRRGELRDDIPARLVATRTYVSVPDSPRFPPAARRFLLDNYVPVGFLRVAGQILEVDENGACGFEIALPGRYVLLSPAGPVAATIDGTARAGPLWLAAGHHAIAVSAPGTPLALVWADAAEKGFSPFHPPPSS